MRILTYLIIFLIVVSSAPSSIANTYFVSAEKGNDANSGLSKSKGQAGPLKTIYAASRKIKSGDKIVIMKGKYYDKIYLRNLDDVTITTDREGEVEWYGTYPEFLNNEEVGWKYLGKSKSSNLQNSQHLYGIPLPPQSKIDHSGLPDWYPSINFLYTADGDQMFGYKNKAKFDARSTSNSDGEGYYFTADSLFAAVNKPSDKKYSKLHVTRSGFTIRLSNCKNFQLLGNNNFTIQYSSRYCIGGEGDLSGLIVKNAYFQNCHRGFYFYGTSGSNLLISENVFDYYTNDKWIWQNIKASHLESVGVAYAAGAIESLIIKDNLFEGLFNGVVSLPGNTLIEGNYFHNIGDDAVELDGPAKNIEVRNNILHNNFVHFSLCPVEEGPVFIHHNLIYSDVEDYAYRMEKYGLRSKKPKTVKFWNLGNGRIEKDGKLQRVSGNVAFEHNTVIARDIPVDICNFRNKYSCPVNSSFVNNIFHSEGTIVASSAYRIDGVVVNHNLLSSADTRSNANLITGWNGNKNLDMRSPQLEDNKVVSLDYSIKYDNQGLIKTFDWTPQSKSVINAFQIGKANQRVTDSSSTNPKSAAVGGDVQEILKSQK